MRRTGTHHPSLALKRWTVTFVLLSLFAGCSPSLRPEAELTPQTLQGSSQGEPENRLVAFGALPSALPLNADVVLLSRGGKLLVSNDPEYLTESAALPAALYRDEVAGNFRVFYHHANSTRADLTLATAVTNTQAAPVLLFTRGLGRGSNVYPDVAGQGALSGYLGARYGVTHLATLAPGESMFVGSQTAGPGHTASALEEYIAVTPPRRAERAPSLALVEALEAAPFGGNVAKNRPYLPAGFSLAAVTVAVVAYTGAVPDEPGALPVMPAGPLRPVAGTSYSLLSRGTFPFFDRHAEIALRPATPTMLTLNSAVSGHFSRTIRGEYLLGRDAVNGRQGFNNGNYGVMYNLRLCASTDAPLGLPFAILMQPAGGVGHYVVQAEGDTVSSPFVSYKNGWWFYRELASKPESCMSLQASLTGGAFGPQKFFFVPFPLF